MSQTVEMSCVCGHDLEPHQHYRRGSDCSLCPPGGCHRFRPAGVAASPLHRLLAAWLGSTRRTGG